MIDDPLNRLKVKRGSDLPQSKLNEKLVKKIREEYAEGKLEIQKLQNQFSAKGMARKYGVHVRTIEKVLSGTSWSHVE